jgi:hypothetical protein
MLRLAHSRTAPVRSVQRARIVWPAHQPAFYGSRGKAYLFGTFKPVGEALTVPYAGWTKADDVDVLTRVEAWIPPISSGSTRL